MNFLKKNKYDILFALALILLLFIFIYYRDSFGVLSDRESFQQFIGSFGILAPLVIVITIIFEVVLAPIPGFVPAATAGFIFGPLEGALYAYAGNVIGSSIVFLLARKYGRFFVEKIASRSRVDKYEKMIERRSSILFFFYFLPILPTDIISISIGLSDIKFTRFFKIMSFGFIINVAIITLFGDYLARVYF